jgi:hypothetical protein
MLRKMLAVATLALAGLLSAPLAAKNDRIQLMVLGTYPFEAPGSLLNNLVSDDTTSMTRQTELADVAQRLAKFQPTKVVMDQIGDQAGGTVSAYQQFNPGLLATARSEAVQVGYRLAILMGHQQVFGVGEALAVADPAAVLAEAAKAGGKEKELAEVNRQVGRFTSDFNRNVKRKPVRELLAWVNDAAHVTWTQRDIYYSLLRLDTLSAQPGADFNGQVYSRNARLFSRLMAIAKPGDRVVLIVPASHAYWLWQFAQTTPGVELVSTNRFLK